MAGNCRSLDYSLTIGQIDWGSCVYDLATKAAGSFHTLNVCLSLALDIIDHTYLNWEQQKCYWENWWAKLADGVGIGGLPSMIRCVRDLPHLLYNGLTWQTLALQGGHGQKHMHRFGRHAPGTLSKLVLGMHTYRLTHVLGCGPYVCNWIVRCPVFMYYWGARLIRKKRKRLIRDMLISLALCSLERSDTSAVGWGREGGARGENWVMPLVTSGFFMNAATFFFFFKSVLKY